MKALVFPFFLQDITSISQLPDVVTYAIRFPAELRTNNSELQKFTGFFYNWSTNRKLTDEFSSGPRNKEDEDGGSPPGYVNVNMQPNIFRTKPNQLSFAARVHRTSKRHGKAINFCNKSKR